MKRSQHLYAANNTSSVVAASTRRVVPSGLPTLPINVVRVNGVGSVTVDRNPLEAAVNSLPSLYSPTACHVTSTGTDTLVGGNTTFATTAYAVRIWPGGSEILVESDLTEPGFDFRNTNASQSWVDAAHNTPLMKIIRAQGHTVLYTTPGPALSALTFTQNGTYSNVWSTPPAFISGSVQVTRTVRDDALDSEGFSQQAKQYSSLATLAAGAETFAQYYDDSAKQLHLTASGTDINTLKSALRAMYLDSSGNSRIIQLGTVLVMDGVYLEGVQFVQEDALSSGTTRQSTWLRNVRSLWATGKGAGLGHAGDFVAASLRMHAPRQDGVNPSAKSATGKGFIQLINANISNPGDLNIFAVDGSIQCSSAHGESDCVLIGGRFVGANGQTIADTCADNSTDVSWYVGIDAGPALHTPSANLLGGAPATSAARRLIFDTCRSTKAGTTDLTLDSNATAYGYNSATIAVVSGGSITAYTPDSPP